MPYWLRTRDAVNLFRTTRVWEPGDVTLEREMSEALLAFARTGRPASPGVGAWPAFVPEAPRLVWLAPQSQVMAWPHFGDLSLFPSGSSGAAPRPANRPRD